MTDNWFVDKGDPHSSKTVQKAYIIYYSEVTK